MSTQDVEEADHRRGELVRMCHRVADTQGGTTMNNRYRLTAPVEGGYAFWDINDMQAMHSLVTIYKDFPNAEVEVRRLYAQLTAKEPMK
jgi:hypothetical protein